jgi:hypothetical protein
LTPKGRGNTELQKTDVISKFPSSLHRSHPHLLHVPSGYLNPSHSYLAPEFPVIISAQNLGGCKTARQQRDLHGDLEMKAVFAFILEKIH